MKRPAQKRHPSKKAEQTPASRPFAYNKRVLMCDGVPLEALAAEHGTPLYVYSAEQIVYRYELFEAAIWNLMGERRHTVCYSVKANSSLALLRLLGRRGAGFDIVSGGELERVRRAHKPALKRIVFSGVGKQAWEIDAALKAGILIFNVESEAELELLAERAEAIGVIARFALRVNPDVFAETHPYISTGMSEHKFGIEIGKARRIYKRASRHKALDAAGVSVHIGSQIRSVEPFRAAMKRVVALVAELRKDRHDIRFIDAGGGLGIDYTNADFDAASEVAGYAAAIGAVLGETGLHLLLEPGRFIVAQAGGLLTRVLYLKRNGAKTFVVADAGMNDLIRPSLYQAHHEIWPVSLGSKGRGRVDVVGPVCESGDFFARDRVMASLRPGDLVVILDAGAYGMSLSSNYNTRTRPAEVLVEGGKARIVRRRETLSSLLALETT